MHVAHILFVTQHGARIAPITSRDHHQRQAEINQRVWPVFGFSRGIAFGVNVGDFFEFECSIHGDGVVDGAAKKHEIVHAIVKLGELLHFIGRGEDGFRFLGKREKFANVVLGQRLRHLLLDFTEVERKQK